MARQELSRRKPLLANRTPPEVEALILAVSLELPAYGQVRIANELRKRGHSLSPAGVRGVIRRFLIHVLPDGFHRIRHYGLLASAPPARPTSRRSARC